jgi:hypothetical protein
LEGGTEPVYDSLRGPDAGPMRGRPFTQMEGHPPARPCLEETCYGFLRLLDSTRPVLFHG